MTPATGLERVDETSIENSAWPSITAPQGASRPLTDGLGGHGLGDTTSHRVVTRTQAPETNRMGIQQRHLPFGGVAWLKCRLRTHLYTLVSTKGSKALEEALQIHAFGVDKR